MTVTAHFPRSGVRSTAGLAAVTPEWVPPFDPHSRLQWARCTQQEIRMLELCAQGYSGKQEAALLGIGMATVRYHRSNLLHKVGARNMAHAVALAYQDGVLTVGAQLPAVVVNGVEYLPARRLAA